MTKGKPSRTTKKTSSKQGKTHRNVTPVTASSSFFPTGSFWFITLSVFLSLMALPVLIGKFSENSDLSSAYLAPLSLWGGTALLAFWFSRPTCFKGDRVFIALTLLLFGLGIVEQLRLESFRFTWQVWRAYTPMLIGIGGFLFGVRFLRAEHLQKWLSWPLLRYLLWITILALLGALLCFGRRYRGGIFLPGQINPTELIKLLAVLLGATWLPTLKDALSRHVLGFPIPTFKALFQLAFFWGIPLAGVILVRDLGLVLILCLTFVVMLTALTRNPFWLLLGLVGATGSGMAICTVSAHTAARFAIWQNPFADPLGKGYQILQSLCAMNAGGLTGSGLYQGMPGCVPIVSSDFVYAAIAEEWGLVGCALLLLLYTLWIRGFFQTAATTDSPQLKLTGYGLGAVLAVQILLNIGGVTKALPMTGITLPFLSHGGFSLLTTFFLCAIAVALSKKQA